MKHRGGWLAAIVILAVLGTACIAGGIVLLLRAPTAQPGNDVPTTPTTTVPAASFPRADGTLTDAEKAAFNEDLNFTFYRPFTQMMSEGLENLAFDTNLLATAESRMLYAWQSAIGEETVSYIDELRADGEWETGAIAIKEADFVAFYAKLFGQEADMEALTRVHPNFTLRDGYIYGHHITGWGLPSFVLKVVSFKDNGNERFSLAMDMLTSYTVETSNGKTYVNVDDQFILRYVDETLLEYPAEAVHARVTVELTASENGYGLKEVRVTRP